MPPKSKNLNIQKILCKNEAMRTHGLLRKCTINDFKCKSHPNTCISQSMVCDGIYDCVDHSDEADCYARRNRIRTKKDGDLAAPSKLIGLFK